MVGIDYSGIYIKREQSVILENGWRHKMLLDGLDWDRKTSRSYLSQTRKWVREHPEADGYLVVWGGCGWNGNGGHFYKVAKGECEGCSAIEAIPEVYPIEQVKKYSKLHH